MSETDLDSILYRLSEDALSDLDTIEICPDLYTGSFRNGDLLVELGLLKLHYRGPGGFLGLSSCSISDLGREVLSHAQER